MIPNLAGFKNLLGFFVSKIGLKKQKHAVIPYLIRNLFANITAIIQQTLNQVPGDLIFLFFTRPHSFYIFITFTHGI